MTVYFLEIQTCDSQLQHSFFLILSTMLTPFLPVKLRLYQIVEAGSFYISFCFCCLLFIFDVVVEELQHQNFIQNHFSSINNCFNALCISPSQYVSTSEPWGLKSSILNRSLFWLLRRIWRTRLFHSE